MEKMQNLFAYQLGEYQKSLMVHPSLFEYRCGETIGPYLANRKRRARDIKKGSIGVTMNDYTGEKYILELTRQEPIVRIQASDNAPLLANCVLLLSEKENCLQILITKDIRKGEMLLALLVPEKRFSCLQQQQCQQIEEARPNHRIECEMCKKEKFRCSDDLKLHQDYFCTKRDEHAERMKRLKQEEIAIISLQNTLSNLQQKQAALQMHQLMRMQAMQAAYINQIPPQFRNANIAFPPTQTSVAPNPPALNNIRVGPVVPAPPALPVSSQNQAQHQNASSGVPQTNDSTPISMPQNTNPPLSTPSSVAPTQISTPNLSTLCTVRPETTLIPVDAQKPAPVVAPIPPQSHAQSQNGMTPVFVPQNAPQMDCSLPKLRQQKANPSLSTPSSVALTPIPNPSTLCTVSTGTTSNPVVPQKPILVPPALPIPLKDQAQNPHGLMPVFIPNSVPQMDGEIPILDLDKKTTLSTTPVDEQNKVTVPPTGGNEMASTPSSSKSSTPPLKVVFLAKPFHCSCGISFCNAETFGQHRGFYCVHSNPALAQKNDAGRKVPAKCQHCEFQPDSAAQLSTHMRNVHQSNNTYICNVCGYRAFSLRGIKTHMKSHPENSLNFRTCKPKNANTEKQQTKVIDEITL